MHTHTLEIRPAAERTIPRRVVGATGALLVALGALALYHGSTAGDPSSASRRDANAIPPAALAAVSRGVGATQSAYWVRKAAGVPRVTAPGFAARFADDGVLLRVRGHAETLSFAGMSRGSSTAAAVPTTPHAARNRVQYARGAAIEWYANGPGGLEQGIRLTRRPLAGDAPLALWFGLGGDLRPVLDHDRLGLTLSARSGAPVLRYAGLSVRDAAGHTVPTHLSLRDGRVGVIVDDEHARYPLAVDPFVQSARLTASDGIAGQYVGESEAVSADGSTIVVGGPNRGPGGTYYVFEKPATGWADTIQGGAVTVPAPGNSTDIAHAVAVSANGDTIVAGSDLGPTLVYSRPADGWTGHYLSTPAAKLTPSDDGAALFGDAVGISGDTIVVSARNATVGTRYSQGALYVYARPAGGWKDATETARLTASDGGAEERLGSSVAIDRDTIVASAPSHGPRGALYVFVRPPGGWANATQTAELTTNSGSNVYLGDSPRAVGISGDTIVAGARQADVGGFTAEGVVYVYVKPSGGWRDAATASAQLSDSDPADHDYLGRAVGIAGDTVVAGAEKYMPGGADNPVQRGAAYVFEKPAGGWRDATETQKLTASDAADGDDFGISVGVGKATVAVGAQFASAVTPNDQVGKAYVFSAPADPVSTTTPEPSITPSVPVTVPTPPVTPPDPAPVRAVTPQAAPGALACTSAKVVLINVLEHAGKVRLTGAARAELAGRPLSIRFLATGKTVARGRVGAGGLFSFTVPLPPAKLRTSNRARYQAVLGSHVSLPLKLRRRAEMVQAKLRASHVLLKGRVTGSFRSGAVVRFSLRTTCGVPFRTVATGRLSERGMFRASVPAPTGAAGQIAVYRANTTVLRNGRAEPTFTLPVPPTP